MKKSRPLLGFFSIWLLKGICFGFELNVFQVGQANFTICVVGQQALVFDCGSAKPGEWVDSKKKFKRAKETVIGNLLNGVTEVTIVISHNHIDHLNLAEALQKFCEKHRETHQVFKGWEIVKKETGEEQSMFSNILGEDVNVIPLLPSSRERLSPTEPHDNNLVLKIALRAGGPAILLTGDGSKNLLHSINPDLLCDIGVLILSHHGSNASDELVWFRTVKINNENRPVLYLISSDPKGKDHIPAYETI
ncbi:MAG: hypothetical protein LBJ13_00880 [Puniceicoccales bacterium]|nr:hypothetical protein [Puniceicoccales bacterium]